MSSKPETSAAALENPYLAARREWNERYGDYIAQARNWRLAAILALCAAVISAGGLVHLASQSQIVPYIVRVDKLGAAAAVERADQNFQPDKQVIVAFLARFIANIRSVYTDAGAERTLLKEAYAMINERGEAFAKLNGYMREHDPFKRAETETVTVEVASVLPLSEGSWRIEWREEQRGRDGSKPAGTHWQATVSIQVSPPTSEATIRLNPLGIYINSFNWSQRL
ncbi:MAG: conjugal transfer protein TrbF [Rhodomicrobium sp.]